jgi:hypothetical protein
MTAEEILAMAKVDGVDVALTATGDGLELLSAGDPPPDIVALLKDAKREVISRLQMERRIINHWIADTLIDWPQEHCLGCRRRVLAEQEWIDVTNGDARARFHQECHRAWLAEQEALARTTIGLGGHGNLQPSEERKRHG